MKPNGTEGSMPFAIIAVTILLLSVGAAAVTAGYQRAEDNSDRAMDEIDAVDKSIDNIEAYVNRGLGEIIRSVSTDATLGTVSERCDAIKERFDAWIDYQFPIADSGTVARHAGHDVELVSESMAISSDLGGYIPTYLRGTGTISIEVESQTGRSSSEIKISSDGSYALPLASERGSLFESMAGDGSVSLAQMMSYQLSAIAQYRVLNGYGASSAYGTKGTDSILTDSDVREAYEVCMEAISMICFRNGDESLASKSRVDLADMMASEDGTVSIDLSAIYAQAMSSAVDAIATKWLDYLYAFDVIDAIYTSVKKWKDGLNSLTDFLKGVERVSGVPYLRDVMSDNGYSESDYRYPGSGETTVTVDGLTVTVTNPTKDLFDCSWLKDFKKRHDSEGNYVKKFLMEIVNSAAMRMAERKDLGVITVPVDPYDSTSFIDSVTSLYASATSDCAGSVESALSESLGAGKIYDEFYGSLADEIMGHSKELTLDSELRASIRSALVSAEAASAKEDGDSHIARNIDKLMTSYQVSVAVGSYTSKVNDDLRKIEVLKTVEGEGDGIIKKTLVAICSYGLDALDVLVPVEDRAKTLVSEILALDAMNPYSGAVNLPSGGYFELEDGNGGTVQEKLTPVLTLGSVAVSISKGHGVHNIGFREDKSAAYSTTFSVTVSGPVTYTVVGAGSLAEAMGASSSVMRSGFVASAEMEITVASGWALAGIDYAQSNTILTDLYAAILQIFEPLVEPLRELIGGIRSALTVLSESLTKVAGMATDTMVRLYNVLMDPVDALSDMIQEFLEDAISNAVFNILLDINLGDQSLTFEFFGCTLVLSTSAVTWKSKTKTLMSAEMTVPVAGISVSAGFTAKVKGEMKSENLILTGTGGISGDGWSISSKFDPLMKGGKYLFTMDGKVGKNKISIVSPKLEDYHELGVTLSDVPGIGDAINNIPVPAIGVTAGIDAGFQIRCKASTQTGIIINEYESNPKGEDRGNEWIEILNNTDSTVDLEGYTLNLESKKRNGSEKLSGKLSPGEFLVVSPGFTLINSPEQTKSAGDHLVIRDANGDIADDVIMKKDTSDDSETWQRGYDGSSEWVKKKGTQGKTNGSFVSSMIGAEDVKDSVWSAVQKAFGKVEHITDLDSLVSFLKYLIRYTLEELIDLVSDLIIDASMFFSLDLKDASGSASGGFRVALRTDGDLVKDCLRYISGKAMSLVLGMKNPYRIDPTEMFTENIDLEVMVHAGMGFPKTLSKGQDLPQMDLGVVFRTNLASLTRLAGTDTGNPEMEFGILARDCPEAVIPSKLSPKSNMTHDLWLFKATVTLV